MSEYLLYLRGPFRFSDSARVASAKCTSRNERPKEAKLLYLFDGKKLFHDGPSFLGFSYVQHPVGRGRGETGGGGFRPGHASRLQELSPIRTADSQGRLVEVLDWMV